MAVMAMSLYLAMKKIKMNGYGIFSKYYDILTQNISYKERADYFDHLIGIHGGVKISCHLPAAVPFRRNESGDMML